MRHIVWFAVLAIACERSVTPNAVDPQPAPIGPQPTRVEPQPIPIAKPDPWAGDGSGHTVSDVPKWASDPPNVLRDKINTVNAHVVVLKSVSGFTEYREVLAVVEKTPGVVAAEPFIFVELEIASAKRSPIGIVLKAVEPARVARVLPIAPHIKSGTLESLGTGEPSIVLGDDLARALSVGIGDRVTLSAPTGGPDKWPPKGFRVGGTFHFDFDEYDERLALTSIPAAQAMLARGDQVLGVEAVVKKLDDSADIAAAILENLGGPPYLVQDWYELNKQLFTALYGSRRP